MNAATDDASGRCLCGSVRFTIHGPLSDLYQCHCSQCRRSTGSAANASTLVKAEQLSWLAGEDTITRYLDDSGYRVHFCSQCGSPVPNPVGDGRFWWVPAGLLDEPQQLKVVAHLFTDSKAAWDPLVAGDDTFATMPKLREILSLLHHRQRRAKRP